MGIGLRTFPPVKARFGNFVVARRNQSQVVRERILTTMDDRPNTLSLAQVHQQVINLARRSQDVLLGVGPRLLPVELEAWFKLSQILDDFKKCCGDVVFCSTLLMGIGGIFTWTPGFVIEENNGPLGENNPFYFSKENCSLLSANGFLPVPARTVFVNLIAPKSPEAGEIPLLIDLELFSILVFHLGYLKACQDFRDQGYIPGSIRYALKFRLALQYGFDVLTKLKQLATSLNPPELLMSLANIKTLEDWKKGFQSQLAEIDRLEQPN